MHNSSSHPRRRKSSGFTLVEMVVASFLTVIGLTGVHNLLYWIMYSTSLSGQRTMAASFTQDKMEELLGAGFSNSTSGQDAHDTYTRSWEVGPVGNGEQEFRVSVSWDDLKRRVHEVAIQSYLADTRLSAAGLPFDKPR